MPTSAAGSDPAPAGAARRPRGLTLLELLVVLAIVGIASVGIASVGVVLLIVLAVMLPIIQLNQLVR